MEDSIPKPVQKRILWTIVWAGGGVLMVVVRFMDRRVG